MRRIFYAVLICAVFIGCAANNRANVGGYSDAALVAEQRLELERLRNDLERMGELTEEVSERIDGLAERLVASLERYENLEALFAEIDRFVRDLIAENSRLRGLQPANGGEDAEAR